MNNPQKILYLHQYFRFPDVSGGTRSYDLARKFTEKGYRVTIITGSSGLRNYSFTKRWTKIEREGIEVWVLKNEYEHHFSALRRIFSFLQYSFFSTMKVLRLKGDLVLATSTPMTIAIPALLKKWLSGTPYVFEVRDVWPEGAIQHGLVKNRIFVALLRAIEKLIYLQSKYVVALSIGMKRCILSRVNVKNIEVIPNISEVNRFREINKLENLDFDFYARKVVLYAGTCGIVNNIMYFADLAELVWKIDPSIAFLVVGRGKQKAAIIESCRQRKILDKNIFFFDPIPKNELPSLYNHCTMGSSFVWDFKIKWDNSANKFFDTLAAGKPILINHEGWQAEVIREYNCGYVLPPKLTPEDAREFSQYINDRDLMGEQGRNAYKLAVEEYSLEVAAEKYLSVLRIALGGS